MGEKIMLCKKIVLSVSLIGTFLVYAFALKHHRAEDSGRTITASPTAPSTTSAQTASPSTVPDTTSPPTMPAMPMMGSMYKDGTYTGPSVNAFYGYVQARIVVTGGKITDVIFLNYPQDRDTSIMINSQAMPILKQEVIQAQSADISGVSGASATTPAFIESVRSAINQALA